MKLPSVEQSLLAKKDCCLGLFLHCPSIQRFLDKLKEYREWKGKKVLWMATLKLEETFFRYVLNIYFEILSKA